MFGPCRRCQGASPVIETTTEVVYTASEIPVGPHITKLLPQSRTETTTSLTVDDARLLSLYSLERVDTAEHPQAVEGVRAVEGIGSRGIATQSEELSSG